MTAPSFPVIRLKPKANPRPVRFGAPWVYADDIVTDRRTKALEPGSFAHLEDANRTYLATVTVNPASKIFARVMARDADVVIDADWIEARVAAALAHRERLYDTPFYRLIHAEADGFPGVIVDRFGDTLVLQPNAAWADAMADSLAAALAKVSGCTTVLKNASGRTRSLEGLDDVDTVLIGQAPTAPLQVPMNGATYMADVTGGQKTGLFFDQRPNHAFVQRLSDGADVLDVFSHVGGFSLAALAAGARSATAVDGSAAALELADQGAQAMGVADRYTTRKGDAFDTLAALQSEGAQFDVVVCDPPAFAPSKSALDRGLRAYDRVARLASLLVKPGGYLVLCSCSHAADLDAFRAACTRGIGKAGRVGQLIYTGFAGADHPQLPSLAESGYLKALAYRLT
ncbi:RSP_2647 family RNA methyltransferase [Cognatishimia sp. MH4019]|uniref:RSP_2647 family RNA methyltransferase n=1 Tax=Cognatishimia sp. MH4019 TaxID=2854030 RepID=UPI001CD74FBA|nr:class I SAM-dependent rRNA methyltransferase [Cognatishimia sp. MH4019]